jgi:hypothetical protein
MSGSGQSLRFERAPITSVLPQRPDLLDADRLFRDVPIADIADRLLDHLVGKGKELRRYVEPKRVGGLEIDHQIDFGWLQHR